MKNEFNDGGREERCDMCTCHGSVNPWIADKHPSMHRSEWNIIECSRTFLTIMGIICFAHALLHSLPTMTSNNGKGQVEGRVP